MTLPREYARFAASALLATSLLATSLLATSLLATSLLATSLLAMSLAGPALADGTAGPAAASGQAVYAASLKNLDDKPESLSEFKGKVSVVYFWATWCVPCRAETPKLVGLNKAYKDKGVEVVGIALDGGDKVRAFAKANGITYPVFYGSDDVTKLGKDLGNDVGGIPFMVVLDKQGKIVATFNGEVPDGKLEKLLDGLVSPA